MAACERVTVCEAAKELGCSPAALREHMKRGLWDLGVALPPQKTGKAVWEFHVYRTKLENWIVIWGRWGDEYAKCA